MLAGGGHGAEGTTGRLRWRHICSHSPHSAVAAIPRTTPGPKFGGRARRPPDRPCAGGHRCGAADGKNAGLGVNSPSHRSMQTTGIGYRRLLRARRYPRNASRLSKHQAVVYLQGEGSIWSFRRASSEAAVKVQTRLKVTAAEGVRAAVLAHVGL